jgi:histidinol-phosphatase
MDQPDLSAELALAHRLADSAAKVSLSWFGPRLPTTLKNDSSPVTEVDGAAEEEIRRGIADAFPDDGVLGEEGGLTEGTNGRLWIIDPIDGTKLFSEGIPLWTTLIGLRIDEQIVLGVADAPALDQRYHAVRGQGAWRGDRRLHVSQVASLRESFVLHSAVEEWIEGEREQSLFRVAARARGTRGLSDAWGHLLVAQGSAEVQLEHEPCFEWDWAATSVIVEEAGGRLSTFEGDRPQPGGDLVVSNGLVHDESLALLAQK